MTAIFGDANITVVSVQEGRLTGWFSDIVGIRRR